MTEYDNGGYLPGGLTEVHARKREDILTEEQWARAREAAQPAIQFVLKWMRENPNMVRRIRKLGARDRKRDRILARQVARATRYPDQAPPLLHKGKAAR